jgi:asparagine synthase (glutamine-hydrolysing)
MICGRIFWLSGENFIRSDKIYMRNSIELRSPFSYQPFRDHFDIRLKKYINKKENKLYLRDYYENKLPKYVLEKEKTGWKSPLAYWYDDEFKKYLLEIISEVEDNNYLINWKEVKSHIENTNKWPGKEIHLYLSLAVLSKEFDLLI